MGALNDTNTVSKHLSSEYTIILAFFGANSVNKGVQSR
jgi:hypothetical protein